MTSELKTFLLGVEDPDDHCQQVRDQVRLLSRDLSRRHLRFLHPKDVRLLQVITKNCFILKKRLHNVQNGVKKNSPSPPTETFLSGTINTETSRAIGAQQGSQMF